VVRLPRSIELEFSVELVSVIGVVTYYVASDGKRFVVLSLPETPAGSERGTVHVTVLQNFFDEVRRRIP